MQETEQLEQALQLIAEVSKPFQLVVVVGSEDSGKSSLIQYCCGRRYQKENGKLTATGKGTPDRKREADATLEIAVLEDTVFFQWRQFQELPELNHSVEQFLLLRLLQSAATVYWVGVVEWHSVEAQKGKLFREFYTAFRQTFPEEIQHYMTWVAAKIPENNDLQGLLERLILYVPNFASTVSNTSLLECSLTDQGESAAKLMATLRGLPSVGMEIDPISIVEVFKANPETALCEALEHQYSRVSQLFLEVYGPNG